MALWLRIPLTAPKPYTVSPNPVRSSSISQPAPPPQPKGVVSATEGTEQGLTAGNDNSGRGGREHDGDSWEWWNQVRTLCGHNPKLGVALEVPANLASGTAITRCVQYVIRSTCNRGPRLGNPVVQY